MKSIILKILLLFITALSVSGCFDVRREIKFYPNGGGVEKMYITLDKALFDTFQSFASMDVSGRQKRTLDTLINNELLQRGVMTSVQKTPGTSFKDILVTDKNDGSKEIFIEYTFDDPSAIIRIIKEATYSFSNQLNINFSTLKFFEEKENVRYKYVIRNASRSFNDSLTMNTFSSIIAAKRVNCIVEFPFEVTGTNAQTQSGNILSWDFSLYDAINSQVEMTADMKKPEGIDLTYAEKIVEQEKVTKNSNPLIRVQVYNANKEPVKIGTGVVLKVGGDDFITLVTNFGLMNLIEGQGYFSIIKNNDSLAGIDEMKETDLIPKNDLCFLRYMPNTSEKIMAIKYAAMDAKYGEKVKILYYPNSLSSVVYSIEGTITGQKKWNKMDLIEVKPQKPLSLDGGAAFNSNGEFMGIITTANDGEVGKLYFIPAMYIKANLK
ncbi:MAG: hypothetical protein EHM58_13790 [Ignavibacteriae bacterium]|nr:MAG: hypothetical protein EHM58_13790 [Ignavibacteriota bacterium]